MSACIDLPVFEGYLSVSSHFHALDVKVIAAVFHLTPHSASIVIPAVHTDSLTLIIKSLQAAHVYPMSRPCAISHESAHHGAYHALHTLQGPLKLPTELAFRTLKVLHVAMRPALCMNLHSTALARHEEVIVAGSEAVADITGGTAL